VSGIAGLLFLDGRSVERATLTAMVERLAHRGPDGSGDWCEGGVGLGHRLLRTTPESIDERLPLALTDDHLAITANARLDNRSDLLQALQTTDRNAPDSTLILRAYQRWGEACPERLLGDFAFAIWDGRRRRLFCARDHLGIKPFYYFLSDRVFVFASEIKALFCLPEIPRRLNEVRVGDYLLPLLEDKIITFYQGILRLPPGHRMTVSPSQCRIEAYWSPDPSSEIRLRSDDEYAEAFREIFTQAVRSRLRSASPIGSLLSGGLDSSSITCVARNELRQSACRALHTFSAVFDGLPECDERPYIRSVLAGGRGEPHFVVADRVSPLVDLDALFWHQDEAFWAPNSFMHTALYRSAGEQNVRVLLDGFDGDTTVSYGFGRLRELLRSGKVWALTRELARLPPRVNFTTRGRIIRLHVLSHLAPSPLQPLLGRGKRPCLDRAINPVFAKRIGLAERRTELRPDGPGSATGERASHLRCLSGGLLPYLLEVADKAACRFAIEPRYPFFDLRLVEFCLALPSEQKLRDGWTRMILRHALGGILPDKIRWRADKANLSPNFTQGLLAFERDLLEQIIMKDSAELEPYLDLARLGRVYRCYLQTQTAGDALTVWKAATLGLWLRKTALQP
jgi:asparagine synthase (glutamine-hydrolysing)